MNMEVNENEKPIVEALNRIKDPIIGRPLRRFITGEDRPFLEGKIEEAIKRLEEVDPEGELQREIMKKALEHLKDLSEEVNRFELSEEKRDLIFKAIKLLLLES